MKSGSINIIAFPMDLLPDADGNVLANKDWGLFAAKVTFSF